MTSNRRPSVEDVFKKELNLKKGSLIDIEKFVKLANEVKESFIEQQEYLEQEQRKNTNQTSIEFLQFS